MNLFQPDKFSDPHIAYEPCDDADIDISAILGLYGFSDIRSVHRPMRKEINSINRKVVVWDTDHERTLLVRKFKALLDVNQIRFFLYIIEDLKKSNVPVSAPMLTEDRKICVQHEGAVYAVYDFIEADHFAPSEKAMESLGAALARMHMSLAETDEVVVDTIREQSKKSKMYFNAIPSYTSDDFTHMQRVLEQRKDMTEEDAFILAEIPACIELADMIQEKRASIDGQPRQVIHSDIHPHNVLMKDDRVIALLDFDSMRVSQRGRDIGFGVYRFGRQKLVRGGASKKDAKLMSDAFFYGYEAVSHISQSEKELIGTLTKDEFLTKILFVLRGIYIDGNTTWAHDIQPFFSALKEIDYFL